MPSGPLLLLPSRLRLPAGNERLFPLNHLEPSRSALHCPLRLPVTRAATTASSPTPRGKEGQPSPGMAASVPCELENQVRGNVLWRPLAREGRARRCRPAAGGGAPVPRPAAACKDSAILTATHCPYLPGGETEANNLPNAHAGQRLNPGQPHAAPPVLPTVLPKYPDTPQSSPHIPVNVLCSPRNCTLEGHYTAHPPFQEMP